MDRPTTAEVTCFFDKVQITKHCWLWVGRAKKGKYGQFYFRGKNLLAHRYSYELFVGPIKPGYCVLHRRECGDPACVNPNHLYMGTHIDNMRDRAMWGETPGHPGESNYNAKVIKKEVLAIREVRRNFGYKYKEIAAMFGLTETHVGHIIRGESWKHLLPENIVTE